MEDTGRTVNIGGEEMKVLKESPIEEVKHDLIFLLTCPAVTSCSECTTRLQRAINRLEALEEKGA